MPGDGVAGKILSAVRFAYGSQVIIIDTGAAMLDGVSHDGLRASYRDLDADGCAGKQTKSVVLSEILFWAHIERQKRGGR